MQEKKTKIQLKSRLANEKHSVSIGKSGITPELIASFKKRLKDNKYLKIKLLKNFNSEHPKKDVANKLALQLKADVIDIRGNCITLYKD